MFKAQQCSVRVFIDFFMVILVYSASGMASSSHSQGRADRLLAVGRWLCGRSFQQAHHCAQQAVAAAEQGGEAAREALAQSLNLLGTTEMHLGQPGAARVSFRRAREEALRLGNTEVQFKVANNMAILHHTAGEWQSATGQFLLAQDLGRQSGTQVTPAMLSMLQTNLANLYNRWGDPARALHLIDAYHLNRDPSEAVRAYAQLTEAGAHLLLAEQSERLGRSEDQQQHLHQAEQLLQRTYALPAGVSLYHNGLCELRSRLLAQLGNHSAATGLLLDRLDGARGHLMDGEIELRYWLGKILMRQPHLRRSEQLAAEEHLNLALNLIDRWGKHYLRTDTMDLLVCLYEQQGRLPEALEVMHRMVKQLRGELAQATHSADLLPPSSDPLSGEGSQAEWKRRLQLAEHLARRDALTGITNRRGADEALPGLLQQLRAPTQSMHLLMIDLDHFKEVNDGHSHIIGDRVLQSLARLLTEVAGLDALTARYGGEEFLVALSGVGNEEARRVAEQLRQRTMQLTWDVPGLAVTVSIGLTRAVPQDTVSSLMARADEALYRAKRGGRNRVVELPPSLAPVPAEQSRPAPHAR